MESGQEAALLVCGPITIAVLSACALSRFAERGANRLSFLASVLGVTLALSVIAVVPYDVWEALVAREARLTGRLVAPPLLEVGEGRSRHEHSFLRSSWAAIYWTTSVLCYLLCPVLMEFEVAGDFSVGARLRTSLRRNVVFYIAYIVVGLVVLVWLIVRGEVQRGSLESWCIAASNAWGLLLLTVLMGYGLVAVPRHLWRLASPSGQLQGLYALAVARDEARLSSIFELQDMMAQVRAAVEEVSSLPGETEATPSEAALGARQRALSCVQKTLDKCERIHWDLTCNTRGSPEVGDSGRQHVVREDDSPRRSASNRSTSSRSRAPVDADTDLANHLKRLAQLHFSLKAAGLEARRASCRWDNHVHRCIFFEDLQNEQFKAAAEIIGWWPRSTQGLGGGRCCRLRHSLGLAWRRMLAFWLCHCRARALRALSYACGALSAVVVLGQLTMFDEHWTLSLLSALVRRDRGPWLTQVLCIVPLSYMACTAYFSIFRIKIAGWYGFYGNHSTDSGSLLWCASILARLSAPLCYHFLLLIRVQGTTFQAFMGKLNVVPALGASFNEYFPIIIAILCVFNLLNVYSRIMQCLSFGTVEFELGYAGRDDDPFAEGRQLVERERRRRSEEAAVELKEHSHPERLSVPLAAPAG